MIQRDPEKIVLLMLMDQWPGDHHFGPDRISDGWWNEGDNGHQVTVTHFDSTVDGETGYTGTGPAGMISRFDGAIDVDVWIAYNEDFDSMGGAKDLRWNTERVVRKIIADNGGGTTHDGERELTHLGVTGSERTTEADDDPTIFRSRLRVVYGYDQNF